MFRTVMMGRTSKPSGGPNARRFFVADEAVFTPAILAARVYPFWCWFRLASAESSYRSSDS